MKELSELLRKRDSVKWNGLAHHIRCLAHVINLAVKAFLSNLKVAKLSEEHEWLSRDDPEESDVDEFRWRRYLRWWPQPSRRIGRIHQRCILLRHWGHSWFQDCSTQDSNDIEGGNSYAKTDLVIPVLLSSRQSQASSPYSWPCHSMERNLQHAQACIVSQTSYRYVDSIPTDLWKASDVISRVGYGWILGPILVSIYGSKYKGSSNS